MYKFLQRIQCEIVRNKHSLAALLLLGGGTFATAASYYRCCSTTSSSSSSSSIRNAPIISVTEQEAAGVAFQKVSTTRTRRILPAAAAATTPSSCTVSPLPSSSTRTSTATVASSRTSTTSSHLLATSVHKEHDDTCTTSSSRVPQQHQQQWKKRTYQTQADLYFQKYGKIPLPRVMHAILDITGSTTTTTTTTTSNDNDDDNHQQKILIMGDVHGCLDELKALVTKACTIHNDSREFAAVILVGDLCNKGPYSSEVIQYVRERNQTTRQRNWYAVRGNHDNAALAAALGDVHCQQGKKKKYEWVQSLSDEDVEWMSELPYTITIRKKSLGGVAKEQVEKNVSSWTRLSSIQDDIIVVHAGLLPGLSSLEDQTIETMTTLRDVQGIDYQTYQNEQISGMMLLPPGSPCAWAKLWNGPQVVVFGHDAKRGLQKEKYAIGLDTGACYGKKLTGIVLPDEELVSVESFKTYCDIQT